MDIRPLRVRLDLAKVNVPSYRRYVWYPVSPCALSTIGDLKENICKKFNLSLGEVLLFVDGGLMQDEDTVLLLRENDVVQIVYTSEYQDNVQPVYEDFMDIMPPGTLSDASFFRRTQNLNGVSTPERKKKKKKKKRKYEEMDVSEHSAHHDVGETADVNGPSTSQSLTVPSPVKSRDELSVALSEVPNSSTYSEVVYSVEKIKPLKFNTVQSEAEMSNHFIQNLFPSECTTPNTNLDSKLKSKNNAKVTTTDLTESTYADVSAMSLAVEDTKVSLGEFKSTNCKKRKRKRKRRRVKQDISFDASEGSSISYAQTSGKHAKFTVDKTKDESVAAHHTQTKASLLGNSATAGGSASEDTDSVAEGSMPVHSPKTLNGKKDLAETPSPPSAKIDHTWLPTLSSSPIVGSRIALKAAIANSSPAKNDHTTALAGPPPVGSQITFKAATVNPLPVKIDQPALPTLSGPPPIGTRIAFKMLELSDMYCPEVSDIKEGTVTAVDPESENIVIRLTNPETKQPREGKFENIYEEEEEEEQPKCQIIQEIAVKWPDLIDPRLLLHV